MKIVFDIFSIEDISINDVPILSQLFVSHCHPAAQPEPGLNSAQVEKPTSPNVGGSAEKIPVKSVPKAAPKKRKPGFWKIPYSGKQKSEYSRAMTICKKYNLPYPEAIKKWEKDHPNKGTSLKVKPLPPPPDTTLASNDARDPAPAQEKTNGTDDIHFEKGDKVKQVREEPGKAKAFGVLEVVEIRAGLVKCRDSGGWHHKINPRCLEPLTGGITCG